MRNGYLTLSILRVYEIEFETGRDRAGRRLKFWLEGRLAGYVASAGDLDGVKMSVNRFA